jgi:NADPH-dependent curcumin reductase CurA
LTGDLRHAHQPPDPARQPPPGRGHAGNFKLVTTDTPALQDGQVLVRHHYLSLDPYMRGRMNDAKSYAACQPLGQVMQGGTVGEVVESRHPKFAVGDKWSAWAAGRNTAWSTPTSPACCARWTPPMCRCRTTWAPWACRA